MKKSVLFVLFALCTALAFSPFVEAADMEEPLSDKEYMYNSIDPDGSVTLQTDLLGSVVNMETALNAVRQQIQSMDIGEKEGSANGEAAANIDLTTLFAETAISNAARTQVRGNEIEVSESTVASLARTAEQTNQSLEQIFEEGGIETARDMSNTVTFLSDSTEKITIRVKPSILNTTVDKVRIETPTYAITMKVDELREDLHQTLTITAEDRSTEFEYGTSTPIPSVRIEMPDGALSNPITLSMSTGSAEPTYMAVMNTEGNASSSKYNPVTASLDGRVNASGEYTPLNNAKNFTDIANKDAQMQRAILELSARGIINGTSETTFSPDDPLKRSHFVALIMRGLGKIDSNARANFSDVSQSDYYYAAVASSQKRKIIEGYPDGCFHGDWLLNKRQIYTVTGRILVSEMGYRAPTEVNRYLNKFRDVVSDNANMKSMIALSVRENLVILRWDSLFGGDTTMTRGNAAVVLYSLFQRIW